MRVRFRKLSPIGDMHRTTCRFSRTLSEGMREKAMVGSKRVGSEEDEHWVGGRKLKMSVHTCVVSGKSHCALSSSEYQKRSTKRTELALESYEAYIISRPLNWNPGETSSQRQALGHLIKTNLGSLYTNPDFGRSWKRFAFLLSRSTSVSERDCRDSAWNRVSRPLPTEYYSACHVLLQFLSTTTTSLNGTPPA